MFPSWFVLFDFDFSLPATIVSKILYYHNTNQKTEKFVSIHSRGKQYSLNFYLITELLFLGWGRGGGDRSVDFGDPAFKIRRD